MQPSMFRSVVVAAVCAASLFIARTAGAVALPTTAAAIQEAFENVRESLANLLTAKDERRIDELRFRINTYRDILRFTATEIQDVRIQLGALEKPVIDSPEAAWRTATFDGLDTTAAFVTAEQAWLDAEESILSLDGIRDRAGRFQAWRETVYRRVTGPARELLLVRRQTIIIDTATGRLKKIADDVKRMQRARVRGVADLAKQLAKAEMFIREAAGLEDAARRMVTEYQSGYLSTGATTTTSTVPREPPAPESPAGTNMATSTASTTIPVIVPPTITGLVRASLEKVREAYRLFLEMSTAVQRLMQ